MNNIRSFCFILLVSLCFGSNVFAAGLSAQLDRNRIAEGETVLLTLTAPGDTTDSPDLTALNRDFDILNQSQSTRMTIINGRSNSTREWQLVLAPKQMGKLTIPAIQLGGLSTQKLSLEVLPAAQASETGASRPVLLEIDSKPKSPYVQSQVIYTVRVLARTSISQASLTEPEAGDAIIEHLGEDKNYSTMRNGQQYQVIERKYAIFPQHSGKLEIKAPLLSAKIPEQNNRTNRRRNPMFGHDPLADMQSFFGHDPFEDFGGFFGQTRTIQLRGHNLSLDVQPQPSGTPSPWLPAESLSMKESWSPDPAVFRVGEPVTRTITITAKGITASQLPELAPSVPDGVKVYPDKSQTETQSEGDTLVSKKVIKSALIPSESGEMVLPEVRLSWWDSDDNKQRIATLPEHKIQVLPMAAGVKQSPPVSAKQSDAIGTTNPISATSATPSDSAEQGVITEKSQLIDHSSEQGYWPWLAAAMFLAWLVTTILWQRARRANPVQTTPADQSADNTLKLNKARDRFHQACQNNDPKAARLALLEWAAARWPKQPPRRLETLSQYFGSESIEVLQKLDRCLFANTTENWDGEDAWERLSLLIKKPNKAPRDSTQGTMLPPLYPQKV
ncbi:MAG: BatD family protein [Candidatus Thiodiazotropha sp.]